MKKMTLLSLSLVWGLVGGAAVQAASLFEITEVYVGIDGEDGTPDWIEITNFGDMDGDTATLWYDDESLSTADGVQLPSYNLTPGESAVFIVTGDAVASSVTDFQDIWGIGFPVLFASGGGGLSQDGDTAAILLADDTVVDSFVYEGFSGTATLEEADGTPGSQQLSVVGVNGAYESNPFFNDNIGVNDMINLVGSPGRVVPEPTSIALAAFGLLSLLGVRRK